MNKIYKKFFHTREEADAFVQGVEFVNDSMLEVLDVKLQKGMEPGEENAYVVRIEDKP